MLNKIILPFKYFIKTLKLFMEYMRDMVLYMKYNNFSPLAPKKAKNSFKLIIDTHKIEKGLSLPNPKIFFGKANLESVVNRIMNDNFVNTSNNTSIDMSIGAVNAYFDKFSSSINDDENMKNLYNKISNQCKNNFHQSLSASGIKKIEPIEAFEQSQAISFLATRASCRNYSDKKVDLETVRHILELAKTAPSQCNRQSVKVHYYNNYDEVQSLLKIQATTAAFSENISNLFVVTSDISAWMGPQQRNQLYIDGGIFSMSLLLACHTYNLGAIALNLAVTHLTEKNIKNLGNIPDNERVIMMIAFGYKTESQDLVYAASPRFTLDEFATFHSNGQS